MATRDEALDAARRYLLRNPAELGRAVRGALGLRLGVPVDALRWAAERAEKSGKVADVVIESVPPGVHLEATVDAMKTKVRVKVNLYIQRVKVNKEELRVELRLESLKLELAQSDASSPVALLIKSGVLDLSKPGNVIKQIPNLPPMIVDGSHDKITLDFMKLPKVAKDEALRRRIEVITALLTVHGVETDEGHLDVSLRAVPEGFFTAARTVRRLVVRPGVLEARKKLKQLRSSWL